MSGACRGVPITMIYDRLIVLAIGFWMLIGSGCTAAATGQGNTNESEVGKHMTEVTESGAPANDIRLEVRSAQTDDAVTLRYTVTNTSGGVIYLMDAFPAIDPQSREPYADNKGFYLCKRGEDAAMVLRGIPPLPIFPVAVRVMPLATRLEPGAKVEREFSIPVPMRERNDWYYPPVSIEEHTVGSVSKLNFAVHFIRESIDGFQSSPVPYAPDYLNVSGTSTVKQAEMLTTELPIRPVHLFIRKDIFTRI